MTPLGLSPEWVAELPAAAEAGQLLAVAVRGGSNAWVSLHERDGAGNWQMLMTTEGLVGRAGLGKTREGDGKTPRGTFGFDAAFGTGEDPGCAMDYVRVDETMYWSGDSREGMRYNQLVSIRDLPWLDTGNSEHLVDFGREYRYCLNIDFNKECRPNAGSAIFLHCLAEDKPYTGGCVVIPEERMLFLMQHVRPDCVVVIDSLHNLGGD